MKQSYLNLINYFAPEFLDSTSYFSSSWKTRAECKHEYPIQRRLCNGETVADFDKVKKADKAWIYQWFFERDFRFAFFNSSDNGCHVHFFTKVHGKYRKQGLLKIIEQSINKDRKNQDLEELKIDDGPVMRNWIRSEDSMHPKKGTRKILLWSNISHFFYINELSDTIMEKVQRISLSGPDLSKIPKETGVPQSIRYMQSNSFADGRNRIMFCLVSWYKSQGFNNDEIYQKIQEWVHRQSSCYISPTKIHGCIYSSTGLVRETYRKKLLDELGIVL